MGLLVAETGLPVGEEARAVIWNCRRANSVARRVNSWDSPGSSENGLSVNMPSAGSVSEMAVSVTLPVLVTRAVSSTCPP